MFIKNFKNILFESLITRRTSRIFLIYRVVRCHKDGDSEEYVRTYYEALNHTLYRGRGSSPNTFHGLQAMESTKLKNNQIFSLVVSKLMSAFYLWLYNLVQPTIISTNTLSKNSSRSLRGVTILCSLLNFPVFARSTTSISRVSHFISKTGGFGYLRSYLLWPSLSFSRVDGFFSQLELACLCYLEPSYTVLQNCRIKLQNYKITKLQPLLISN